MDPMIESVTNSLEQSNEALNESFKEIQKLHSKAAISVVNSVNKAIRKMDSERNRTAIYCMLFSFFGSAVTCGVAIAIFK